MLKVRVLIVAAVTSFIIVTIPARGEVQQERKVVHASHEDCEIIIEIGKAEVAWGANGPNQPFAIDGIQTDGSIYREDCSWSDFGVGRPTPATAMPGTHGFGVDKPSYASDGKTATATLDFVVISPAPGIMPFLSEMNCKLQKVHGHWQFQVCTQGLIT